MKKIIVALICSLMIFSSCSVNNNSTTKDESSSYSSEVKISSDSGSEGEESSTAESELSFEKESEVSDVSESSETAQSSDENSETDEENENSSTVANEIFSEPLCRSAVLYCSEDNKILYDDYKDIRTAPASLTKLMTASVMLRNMSPDDIVTVGTEQRYVNEDSSRCYITEGNRLTVRDLLTGMLLCSGNDAAYTAAVSTARAAKNDPEMSDKDAIITFAGMMNDLAAEIGMTNSHFVNPDGWDNDEQYVTASDLLKLAKYAYSVPEIRTIVGTQKKYVVFESGENITWTNTNYLLDPDDEYYCPEAVGMKTGTTSNAGYCLIATFRKNGKTYISVVTGCENNAGRYGLTLKLFSLI